jgi:hypothetical protein
MSWNAVLIENPDARAGRSYMEHVVALSEDASLPIEVRQAAQRLRDTPPAPPPLITIGRPDLAPAEAARIIVNEARRLTSGCEGSIA